MTNKQYIYVGEHYDCCGRVINIKDKKIGLTNNLTSREYQLNKTKSPIGYRIIEAWEVEDMNTVETVLHTLLEPLNTNGEWFRDDEDTLVDRVNSFMVGMKCGVKVDYNNTATVDVDTLQTIKKQRQSKEHRQMKYLVGETFKHKRYGVEYSVYCKSEHEFVLNNQDTYDTLSKAATDGNKLMCYVWDQIKNVKGKTPDDVCKVKHESRDVSVESVDEK